MGTSTPVAVALRTRKDARVDTALRFELEKTKFSLMALFRDGWLGKTSINGRYENPVRGPSVVVKNAQGERRILEVARSVKEAQDRADAIEKDYNTLDTAQWCERYDVPISFVGG
jgi:hypothetical protein